MSQSKAAATLGITQENVSRLLRSGALKGQKSGTGRFARWLINLKSIEKYRAVNGNGLRDAHGSADGSETVDSYEAARALGVHHASVNRLWRAGRLDGAINKRKLRVTRQSIDRFLSVEQPRRGRRANAVKLKQHLVTDMRTRSRRLAAEPTVAEPPATVGALGRIENRLSGLESMVQTLVQQFDQFLR